MKKKTYRKPVFSGKNTPMIGMDQGKGRMYKGLGTHYCFNLFYDVTMLNREGQDKITYYEGVVQNGGTEKTIKFVHEATNVWIDEG